MNVVIAAALGLGLGIVTGMPLGVVNVAIVDAAASGNRRHAIGIGIGGAIADAVHAALAFIGIGALVTARPDVIRWLAFASAALIATYAIITSRRRPATKERVDGSATRESSVGSARESSAVGSARESSARGSSTGAKGVGMGFLLTLPNPGALSAWVAVAASLWPGASTAESITFAAGVGIGSAAWFALLAYLVGRIPREHRALRLIPRVALLALLGIAVVGIVRVL